MTRSGIGTPVRLTSRLEFYIAVGWLSSIRSDMIIHEARSGSGWCKSRSRSKDILAGQCGIKAPSFMYSNMIHATITPNTRWNIS